MTHAEWTRIEPLATQALGLPEAEREALLSSANVSAELRQELLAAYRRIVGSRSVVVTPTPTTPDAVPLAGSAGGNPPRPPLPVLAAGLPLDDGRDAGRYVVIRQIGRGGMGTVFLAHDTKLGVLVALKVTPYDERLLEEARRAAACSGHPHVATIHDTFRQRVGDQDVGILVMEYVAGTPASRLLDDGPVDIRRALRWARQVADAIAHAHDHQVLHCDLKPANIMITPDGQAKVLDFGIARATFDPSDAVTPVRGTVPYMAPEQLFSKQFSPAGDIYSLGVTLFELVTGRLPFSGEDALLRLRILVAPPPDAAEVVAELPAELQKVLDRAMAKEPDKRFRSARSLVRALEAVETGNDIPLPVAPPPAPTSLATRLALFTAAVAAVAGALITLGAYTSATYNLTLERAGFASESIFDWLNWGFRASTGPLALLVITTLAWGATRLVGRLLLGLVDSGGRLREQVSHKCLVVSLRTGVDAATASATAALITSIVALGLAIFMHRDLFPAFVALARTAPPEQLALLAPEYIGEHNAYRRSFTLVVIITVAAWYAALKTSRRRRETPRGLLTAGAVTLFASFVLLHHPHRMMFSETAGYGAEAVRWEGNDCYVLGQRGSDTLLLCPGLDAPRQRIVRTGDASLVPLGVRESVFRGFYREANRRRAMSTGS